MGEAGVAPEPDDARPRRKAGHHRERVVDGAVVDDDDLVRRPALPRERPEAPGQPALAVPVGDDHREPQPRHLSAGTPRARTAITAAHGTPSDCALPSRAMPTGRHRAIPLTLAGAAFALALLQWPGWAS